MIQTLKENLKNEIKETVIKCGYVSCEEDINVILENAKDAKHGDYSTNIAMQLTKRAKKNPRIIAEEIVKNFDTNKYL